MWTKLSQIEDQNDIELNELTQDVQEMKAQITLER